MAGDDDLKADVDSAINAGGREELYKDLTRQAAGFRGVEDQREVEEALKDKRRQAARQRRVSFRSALERGTSRQTGR